MKKIFFLFFSVSLYIFSAADIFAADFLFTGSSVPVKTGDEFQITFSVDANQSSINAVAGKIFFSKEIADLQLLNTGISDINFWVEKPAVSDQGEIKFSGIVPNGFKGKISLFSAVFKAKSTGVFSLNYGGLEALNNDGAGTAEETKSEKFIIDISEPVVSEKSAQIILVDNEQPENFSPEILRDINFGNENYFLIFHTEDKQSGIDHFEILEQKTFRFLKFKYTIGDCNTAVSPYELKDQKLASDIFVKAFDKQGNIRTVFLAASSPTKWYENRFIWSIIILLAAIIIAFLLFYANKYKKNHK